MQNVNTSYTVFVNRKYNRSGPLFQGRYKGFIIDKDGYLLALSRYIHLNPVRAGAVKRAEEYRWSSYREYLYGSMDGTLTDTDETLSFFSKHRAVAVRKYREFVEAGIRAKTPLLDATGSILGGRAFRERVHKLIRITSDKAGIPEIRKIEKKHEIKDIIKGIADY